MVEVRTLAAVKYHHAKERSAYDESQRWYFIWRIVRVFCRKEIWPLQSGIVFAKTAALQWLGAWIWRKLPLYRARRAAARKSDFSWGCSGNLHWFFYARNISQWELQLSHSRKQRSYNCQQHCTGYFWSIWRMGPRFAWDDWDNRRYSENAGTELPDFRKSNRSHRFKISFSGIQCNHWSSRRYARFSSRQ